MGASTFAFHIYTVPLALTLLSGPSPYISFIIIIIIKIYKEKGTKARKAQVLKYNYRIEIQ